jgi:mono/diheme cytochrome c family protein
MSKLRNILLTVVVLACVVGLLAYWQRGRGAEAYRDQVERGRVAYEQYCAKCHQRDGWGEEPYLPALRRATDVLQDKDRLIHTIVAGKFDRAGDVAGHTIPLMPPANLLSEQDIADVIAYITQAWGYRPVIVSAEQVAAIRNE